MLVTCACDVNDTVLRVIRINDTNKKLLFSSFVSARGKF